MKIMFICKHNLFRSRVAEEYMKKIAGDKHDVSSGGLIKFEGGLHPVQKEVLEEEFDLSCPNQSKALSVGSLKNQDIIVIVANDVPKEVFETYHINDKIRIWKISDIYPWNMSKEGVRKIIGEIFRKVDELDAELR